MFGQFPQSISTFANDIDSLFYLILYIVGIGFIIGEGIILFFLFKYRRNKNNKATFVEGNNWSQVAWILIPAGIVLLLDLWIDFAGAAAYDKIKGDMPLNDYLVKVEGKQFNWIFTYPGHDNIFGTYDDYTLENDFHVPINKVMKVILSSQDVIHSFFIPVIRLKQDAVPGRKIEVWFEATQAGVYEIACAELCGFGHYTMRGRLIVHSEADFENWKAEKWPSLQKENVDE